MTIKLWYWNPNKETGIVFRFGWSNFIQFWIQNLVFNLDSNNYRDSDLDFNVKMFHSHTSAPLHLMICSNFQLACICLPQTSIIINSILLAGFVLEAWFLISEELGKYIHSSDVRSLHLETYDSCSEPLFVTTLLVMQRSLTYNYKYMLLDFQALTGFLNRKLKIVFHTQLCIQLNCHRFQEQPILLKSQFMVSAPFHPTGPGLCQFTQQH